MKALDNVEPLAFAKLMPALLSLYEDAALRFSADLEESEQISITAAADERRLVVRHGGMALSLVADTQRVAVYLLPAVDLQGVPNREYPSRLRIVFVCDENGHTTVDALPVSLDDVAALVLSSLNDLLQKANSANLPTRLAAGQTSLTSALRDLLSEKQRLVATLFAQQEQLYKQISMELHDNAIGELVVLQRDLRSRRDCQPEKIADALEQSIQRLRDLCSDLSSREIADWGLVNSLRELCQRNLQRSGINITLEASDTLPLFPYELALQLYRIAQEALTNAIKYSGAKAIIVRLEADNGQLLLEIKDDGAGFKTGVRPSSGSGRLGLKLLKERAELISANFLEAQLLIDSSPAGCRVALTMDLSAL
jgi:signal transduction histidine kinase